MKNYNVYKHPAFGIQAVKTGFSWPALCLGIFWMLAKKLWGIAGLWSLLFLLLNIIGAYALEINSAFPYVVLAGGNIAFLLLPGFKGNEWLAKNLGKRGFVYLGSIQAESPEAAAARFPA